MAKPTIQEHQTRWRLARDARAQWTREARKDLRFANGKVWSDEELEIFREQGREATSYDLISPMLNMVVGLEAQNRQDIKILPRAPQDVDTAEALTKVLKFIGDQNYADRQYTWSFQDCATLGIGWLEVGFNPDPTAEINQLRRVDPFDIWVDPASKEADLSDARDVFRAVWMDPEDLARLFPGKRSEIEGLATDKSREDTEYTDSNRYTKDNGDRPGVRQWDEDDFGTVEGELRQVRAVERWYCVKERARFCRYRDGRVVEITANNAAECAAAIMRNEARQVDGLARRIRVAIFVGDLLLQDAESPFTHGRFPFIPMWGYEDEAGRPVGLVRKVRDPAKEFNARRSHALKKVLSRQVIYETGAIQDADAFARDFASHDALIEVNPGALASGKIQIRDELASNPQEFDLMQQAQMMIQDVSGATPELMGRQTNADSGKAIQARQEQGQVTLYTLFDSRNWAQIMAGELLLANIQETYTQEQAFRITESVRRGFDKIEQEIELKGSC